MPPHVLAIDRDLQLLVDALVLRRANRSVSNGAKRDIERTMRDIELLLAHDDPDLLLMMTACR